MRIAPVALLAVVLASPALASQDDPGFTAVDFAWYVNGTTTTTLTIAPGQSVTFAYPEGKSFHNVSFTGAQPSSCTGLTPYARPPGWQGRCTFATPGTYAFACALHEQMKGRIIVAAATPTPTP